MKATGAASQPPKCSRVCRATAGLCAPCGLGSGRSCAFCGRWCRLTCDLAIRPRPTRGTPRTWQRPGQPPSHAEKRCQFRPGPLEWLPEHHHVRLLRHSQWGPGHRSCGAISRYSKFPVTPGDRPTRRPVVHDGDLCAVGRWAFCALRCSQG